MTDDPGPREGQIILYSTPEGAARIEVLYESETFWLNQKKIADLFGVDVRTISEHLVNIFAAGELVEVATVRKIRRVQREGARDVRRDIDFYNLDAIIAVGYRVNSARATQFRIWATQTLKEFIVKGFVLDDERLKLNAVATIVDPYGRRLRCRVAGPPGPRRYSAGCTMRTPSTLWPRKRPKSRRSPVSRWVARAAIAAARIGRSLATSST
jgi:hypothetical protein